MAIIEAIASQYLETDQASVTFSSIPSSYETLQVRGSHRATGASGGQAFFIKFNGSTSGYSTYSGYGGNTSWNASYTQSQAKIHIYDATHGTYPDSREYATFVMDIIDYANTSKNSTIQCFLGDCLLYGTDSRVTMLAGLWDNTAAVNSITLWPSNGNLTRGSEYTVYGLKSS